MVGQHEEIQVVRRDGRMSVLLLDPDDFERLKRYRFYLTPKGYIAIYRLEHAPFANPARDKAVAEGAERAT
jgi:hypothetical protein